MASTDGDSLMNYSNKAKVSMIGGAGDDVIVVTSDPNEYIDLSKGGKDTITTLNTDTLTVHNYDPKIGATFMMNTHENLTNLIMYSDPHLLVVGDGLITSAGLNLRAQTPLMVRLSTSPLMMTETPNSTAGVDKRAAMSMVVIMRMRY